MKFFICLKNLHLPNCIYKNLYQSPQKTCIYIKSAAAQKSEFIQNLLSAEKFASTHKSAS